MFFDRVVNESTIQMLDSMAAFTQARHTVLTENVANVDTPRYATRRLDTATFQKELRRAVDAAVRSPEGEFDLRSTSQFRVNDRGWLEVSPQTEPAENILFHDRTNVRIEEQMADLAENAMMHQLTSELLRDRYEGLTKAIRGRIA
jgi:flagellar basal-body rod protein FlgB